MLIEFYGKECPHCAKMAPIVEQLEKESGVKLEKLEVWHNEENLNKMREYDNGLCSGVPFFYNTDTKKYICGETNLEELKKWASGEKVNGAHSPLASELDFNYITDGIYIGTNQCCQTHFDEKLQKEGIEVDFSLEENRVDAPFGVKFYIWIPIKNHEAPTLEQLDCTSAILEKFVNLGKKIYLHCKNGHGRAPTVMAAYLIKKGKTLKEAIKLIKKQRSAIHLEELQLQALTNYEKTV